MTDQFSQEYIDYILNDEAKALQEKWEPKFGDWFVATTAYEEVQGDDWPCLDVKQGEVNLIHTSWRIDDDGKKAPDVGKWLPTLWDLLQIIVGKVRPPDNEVAEMASVLEWIASEALERAEPIMLAAAKLAVRALTNRG